MPPKKPAAIVRLPGETIATSIERCGRMLTASDIAPLLNESVKTIYGRVKRGAQPAVVICGSVRFDPHETAEWIKSQSA